MRMKQTNKTNEKSKSKSKNKSKSTTTPDANITVPILATLASAASKEIAHPPNTDAQKASKKRAQPSSKVVVQPAAARRRYWSSEEDRVLLGLLKNTVKRVDGRINWDAIAKKIDGRTRKQCSKRYDVISSQSKTTNMRWSSKEDSALLKIFESTDKRGDGKPDWVAIAKKLDGRNRNQCFKRYSLISSRSKTRNMRWVEVEDHILISALTTTKKCADGRTDWEAIAKQLPGRNKRQCCERHSLILCRSKTTNLRWTPEEDRKLLKAFETVKKHADDRPDWVAIAERLDGRNRKQCSKRYTVLSNLSKTKNVRWRSEEDRILLEAFESSKSPADGRPDWVAIAARVPGRSRIQCFNRYQYIRK